MSEKCIFSIFAAVSLRIKRENLAAARPVSRISRGLRVNLKRFS